MALPSNGQLSVSQINIELERASNAPNSTLRQLAQLARPGSLPYSHKDGKTQISDWYGYSHITATYDPSDLILYLRFNNEYQNHAPTWTIMDECTPSPSMSFVSAKVGQGCFFDDPDKYVYAQDWVLLCLAGTYYY